MSASKWRVFFDIICPNSWISFQVLQKGRLNRCIEAIEFVPICDVKLRLIQTYEQRMLRKERKDSTSQPKFGEIPKSLITSVLETDDYVLPTDWHKCYSSAFTNGSLLPAVFLSSIKYHHPEHFIRSIEVVGRRLWHSRLPIHKGAYLSTCAREVGLSFKDSEKIISELPHVDTRKLLHENSEEALRFGVSQAPLFVTEVDGATVVFDNIHDVERGSCSEILSFDTAWWAARYWSWSALLNFILSGVMSWFRPPPPGTHLKPWVPDLIFIPISRAFERLGVYFYNRVLNKTEIGLFDKRWNKSIHGPYCHYRYYGKLDTKLFDVKLADLPAWISRREKTPSAFYNELTRNIWWVHHNYYSGPVYGSIVKTIFRYIFAFSFLNWLFKAHRYLDFQKTIYHW